MQFRVFILLILIAKSSLSLAGEISLEEIKSTFKIAIDNGVVARKLHTTLSKQNFEKNNLLLAYYGATEGLLAKHDANPFNKLNYIESALDKLNTAVANDPKNIEIRYMRFAIESQLPSFLGKSINTKQDKTIILNSLEKLVVTSVTKKQAEEISHYLIQYGNCNANEIAFLSALIKKCKTI